MCVTIGTCTTKSSEPTGLISFLFDIPVQRDGGLDQGQSRVSHLRLGKQSVVELVYSENKLVMLRLLVNCREIKIVILVHHAYSTHRLRKSSRKNNIFISCFSSVFNMLFSYLIITVLPQACDGTDLELIIGPERQER